MKKKCLEKKLEEELKEVTALLRGIDHSTKNFFPEEEYEKVCTEGLKRGNKLLEELTDEKTKDALFSELIEAEYTLAGIFVKEERYDEAIKHFRSLNQIGQRVYKNFNSVVRNKDFHLEFLRKNKKLLEKYPIDDPENIEKCIIEQSGIEMPFAFNREAEKLLFCTHLSLAYIYAFKRDIKKVVDETIDALKFIVSDSKGDYCGVQIKEFTPFNLRSSGYYKRWFRKGTEHCEYNQEKDVKVVLYGMGKKELDISQGIFKDNNWKGFYKEDISNRRRYCKKLVGCTLLINKWEVNEKTLNVAYEIIATDPTEPGNYLLLMALLEQEGKNEKVQSVMNDVVRLISTKASLKDYDSESVNPNYSFVLKADRYVSKPESEEDAKKQHILSNFFRKYSKNEYMFAESYGYARGIDDKFYLVTALLSEDNLSTFNFVFKRLEEEKKKDVLEQAIDILVEIQDLYEKYKSNLPKELILPVIDIQQVFRDKIIGRFKIKNKERLEDAIQTLADQIDNQEKCFSHGDYHSENIVKTEKGHLAPIDFSYAGFVPLLYDVIFLLEDPKLNLNESLKEDAVKYYLKKKGRVLDTHWKKKSDYISLFVNLRWAGVSSKWLGNTEDETYEQNKVTCLKKSEQLIDKMLNYTLGIEYSNLQKLKSCLKGLY